jgi:hypothetical protein
VILPTHFSRLEKSPAERSPSSRVPPALDAAHVGFVFTDVVGNGYGSALQCAPIIGQADPACECNFIGVSLRLPMASELPLYKTVTSVRRRFLGNSRTSPLLAVSYYVGRWM